MRVFIALDLPENIKKEIARIQKGLLEFSGKKTELENLHLTLKFLGEIEEKEVEEVRKRLKEVKIDKFKARLGKLGVFSEKFIRIVWVELLNCQKLQEEIDNKLKDIFPKEARFMGHVTIARVKNIKDKKEFINNLKKIKVNEIEFEVNEFKLKESVLKEEGPVYEDIEVYELG